MSSPGTIKKVAVGSALVAAGFAGGAVVWATGVASADQGATPSPSASATDHRSPGTPVTGTAADKVTAAVTAKYPGATVEDVTTDDESPYEAHLTLADGTHLSVELDKAFTITGTETHGPREHGDHRGGPGSHGTPVTGTAAEKVTTAVTARYPGATVEDVTTDDESPYEAHLTLADGTHLSVELDKAFTITGTETHGPGDDRGSH